MDAQNTIARLAFDEGRRLAADPNIAAVGYGCKLRKGAPTGSLCLQYYVRRKLSSAEALQSEGTWWVPAQVEGYATDVIELGHAVAATADRQAPAGDRGRGRVEPLAGGTSTASLGTTAGPGGYGTLSCVCNESAGTRAPLALSNAHVWGQTTGIEALQPAFPPTFLGIDLRPMAREGAVVLSRIPPALIGRAAVANSHSWMRAITGAADDPVVIGQGLGSLPATARTQRETVSVQATPPSWAPAGRLLANTASWDYQRESDAGVVSGSSTQTRVNDDFLVVKRVWTDAATYTTSQTIKILAELLLPNSGSSAPDSHFVVAHLYPPAGDRAVLRVLKSCARQSFPTSKTSFTGFPSPATAGAAILPIAVGDFQFDANQGGTFINNPAGGLPANTLALRLSGEMVRIFTPPCTKLELEVDLRGTSGSVSATRFSTAGCSSTGANVTPKGDGRSIMTIEGSEIVEVQFTAPANAILIGAAVTRSSPEVSSVLLSTMGTITAAELGKGRWYVGAFVQRTDTGITESASLVEVPTGAATLLADCYFDVT